MSTKQILPHGGKLINRIVEEKKKQDLLKKSKILKNIQLNSHQISDLEMIAKGAFSPIEGFF